jgi:hypothetical protein
MHSISSRRPPPSLPSSRQPAGDIVASIVSATLAEQAANRATGATFDEREVERYHALVGPRFTVVLSLAAYRQVHESTVRRRCTHALKRPMINLLLNQGPRPISYSCTQLFNTRCIILFILATGFAMAGRATAGSRSLGAAVCAHARVGANREFGTVVQIPRDDWGAHIPLPVILSRGRAAA